MHVLRNCHVFNSILLSKLLWSIFNSRNRFYNHGISLDCVFTYAALCALTYRWNNLWFWWTYVKLFHYFLIMKMAYFIRSLGTRIKIIRLLRVITTQTWSRHQKLGLDGIIVFWTSPGRLRKTRNQFFLTDTLMVIDDSRLSRWTLKLLCIGLCYLTTIEEPRRQCSLFVKTVYFRILRLIGLSHWTSISSLSWRPIFYIILIHFLIYFNFILKWSKF